MPTLEVEFLGYRLKSPIFVASGPASHDVKQIPIAEQMGLGVLCSRRLFLISLII
ncbi:hypothetical protein JGI1_01954 [Candidatus Thermokryptus mobilis]|uniref:Uncharacterized protein n=1 Tax=Candidatus Thermokryptus mobilis TaxID=1643428 RepID=A0A0S4NAI9_9BACT|nr:hypothetical protein [Candidatus Thermokryptus mobilis]CUU07989.1 hypothetical protein JGI1_01954 [Candidatus Thermokryptus mobilis]